MFVVTVVMVCDAEKWESAVWRAAFREAGEARSQASDVPLYLGLASGSYIRNHRCIDGRRPPPLRCTTMYSTCLSPRHLCLSRSVVAVVVVVVIVIVLPV